MKYSRRRGPKYEEAACTFTIASRAFLNGWMIVARGGIVKGALTSRSCALMQCGQQPFSMRREILEDLLGDPLLAGYLDAQTNSSSSATRNDFMPGSFVTVTGAAN